MALLSHKFVSAWPTGRQVDPILDWNDDHVFGGGNRGAILLRDTAVANYGAGWLQSVATGQVLVSGGAGSLPTWSSSLTLTGGGDIQLDGSASGQIKFGSNIDIQANTTNTGFSIGSTSGTNNISILRRDSFVGTGSIGIVIFEGINSAASSYQCARISGVQIDRTASAEEGQLRFGTISGGTLVDRWILSNTGAFVPFVGDTYDLGSSAVQVRAAYANFVAVKDGMTAPGATAGVAKIYVDTGDGDLKVVFGDGVVKTIVVDT